MKFAIPFRPRLLAPWSRCGCQSWGCASIYFTGRDTLKKYSGKDFTADLIAGLTVGIVALPQAGIFTAVIGVPQRWIAVCTIMAGVILLVMGMTRMGMLNKS
jgi:MFS superfamily sulfate permease-like transporter